MAHSATAEIGSPRRDAGDPAGALPSSVTAGWVALLLLGHCVYGLLLVRSPALATAHALITFAVGLWLAMSSTLKRVAIVCAYMAGSEIIWRMGHAQVPWEFVKYGICLVLVIAMSRVRRLRWDWMALLYFGMLIPSTLVSFFEQPFEFARQQVSFNLSGPLVLCVATWFFALLKLARVDIQRLFLAVLAPTVSLAFIASTRAASLEELTFTDASNFQMSAGYGPNQVSTVLGLGVLLAVLLILLTERGWRERALYGVLATILAVQSALTFSRGGLFGALGGFALASPFLLKGVRNRIAVLFGSILFGAAILLVVVPRLDQFTGGALSERFQDTSPTGRDELAKTELAAFAEHPVFGVGPASLVDFGAEVASVHTEFTRLLSQHGSFGAVALLLMVLLSWRAAIQPSSGGRAISIALVGWSLLTMTHAAMRLGITPFVFGMGAAGFLPPARARAGGVAGPSTDLEGNDGAVHQNEIVV